MSVTGAAIGAAIAGGILRGFGTNMKIDSQLRELDANEKDLEVMPEMLDLLFMHNLMVYG